MELEVNINDAMIDELMEVGMRAAIVGVVEDESPDLGGFVTADDLDTRLNEYMTEREVDSRIADTMPDAPDLSDYIERCDFDRLVSEWVVEAARSMPESPERRCSVGQAFTTAIETIVATSPALASYIESTVAEVMADRDDDAVAFDSAPVETVDVSTEVSDDYTSCVELITVSVIGRGPVMRDVVPTGEMVAHVRRMIEGDPYFSGLRVVVDVPQPIDF